MKKIRLTLAGAAVIGALAGATFATIISVYAIYAFNNM